MALNYLYNENLEENNQFREQFLFLDLGCGTGYSSEILLENGIKIHIKDEIGNTPLHKVHFDHYKAQNSLKILNLLLKHGADVNARNNEDKIPLDLITHPSLVEVIKNYKKKSIKKM